MIKNVFPGYAGFFFGNMPDYINYNGSTIPKSECCISPDNRSFRYGDGCFETIKIIDNKILLWDYHVDRLFSSFDTLKLEKPNHLTVRKLAAQIVELATKNKHHKNGRLRLTAFRGDGGLYDDVSNQVNYIIQSWALSETSNNLNENGLVVDFFTDAKKSTDVFANIKSNNFLCYTMAALWAKQNRLNDAILLNNFDQIADASIANIFVVKDGLVLTPPLSDGPVNGVMRRYIINCLLKEGIPFKETSLCKEDILQASEVFFTNAIYGIKWVKQVANSNYTCQLAKHFHNKFIIPLFK